MGEGGRVAEQGEVKGAREGGIAVLAGRGAIQCVKDEEPSDGDC